MIVEEKSVSLGSKVELLCKATKIEPPVMYRFVRFTFCQEVVKLCLSC